MNKVFPSNCSDSAPDISGWELIQELRSEFRVSRFIASYLGLVETYRNPMDDKEFVRVTSRHIPFVPQRQKLDRRSFFGTAAILLAERDQEDRFDELDDEADAIIYERWRTRENPRTGKDGREGNLDIWFLRSNGECVIAQNERVSVQFLTERVGDVNSDNIFIGIKYSIGDAYHIVRVNRRILLSLTKEEE
jgi:hypothetical protein